MIRNWWNNDDERVVVNWKGRVTRQEKRVEKE